MSPLAATLLVLLTVSWGPGLTPVYARHIRHHPYGPRARAEQLASQLRRAARRADVELPLLVALAFHESALDHARVSAVGAVGALQLLPSSRWGRGFAEAVRTNPGGAEGLNVVWGAYALRDGLAACGGDPGRALGFYRAGACREGPRARFTLALARVVGRDLATGRPFAADSAHEKLSRGEANRGVARVVASPGGKGGNQALAASRIPSGDVK